jgi:hypothetical protein
MNRRFPLVASVAAELTRRSRSLTREGLHPVFPALAINRLSVTDAGFVASGK